MPGITYKTRNENEKHENGKTKKDTMFRPWKCQTGNPWTILPFLISLYLN